MSSTIQNKDRAIGSWFPIAAIDEAVGTSHGSGRSEKALMTWFAARPVAQARAGVLAALLDTSSERIQQLINIAVTGDSAVVDGETVTFDEAVRALNEAVKDTYEDGVVVLDPFSGRGMIPLEAVRFGASAIGTDLAPLAVFASRLLAEYPFGDWSSENSLPEQWYPESAGGRLIDDETGGKLAVDVEAFLSEVERRVRDKCSSFYPQNPDGSYPWGYLWAVTIPCDGCNRRFPLLGSLVLRHPRTKKADPGQWLRLKVVADEVMPVVEDGVPDQEPTLVSVAGKRGRVARCPFPCGHVHSLDTIKRKGFEGEYEDRILVAGENNKGDGPSKVFRQLRPDELSAAAAATTTALPQVHGLAAIPDEPIPEGNNDTVRASAYGYKTYGELMTKRQAVQFARTCEAIQEIRQEAIEEGCSEKYGSVLASYAGAVVVRKIRRSTRGARILAHGSRKGTKSNTVQVDHIYAGESKVSDGFDFFESGIGEGPGTWSSIATTELSALRKVLPWPGHGTPARLRQASATALPLRDNTIDVVVTDPPYYNMIDYSDASDLLYVWARRALFDAQPDIFGAAATPLQPKDDEIIVKRGGPENEHRTADFYHERLADSFSEMRRVLKPGGTLTVIFGHHDPDAWVRLLGALHESGFVVTAAWPSRTESANTGVASVRITVTIICHVADEERPTGLVADVDQAVRNQVTRRVQEWNEQELAQPDQNMASYGPAMEAFGAYSQVNFPDGSSVDIERYLLLARKVVREQLSLPIDTLPLDVFDPPTRLAVYWLKFFGTAPLPKGEALYQAQAEGTRLEEVRSLFNESRKGFTLTLKPSHTTIGPRTPLFAVVLSLAAAWKAEGADGVAEVLSDAIDAGVLDGPDDTRLWAVVKYIPNEIPQSSDLAKALAALQRSQNQLVAGARKRGTVRSSRGHQPTLGLESEE